MLEGASKQQVILCCSSFFVLCLFKLRNKSITVVANRPKNKCSTKNCFFCLKKPLPQLVFNQDLSQHEDELKFYPDLNKISFFGCDLGSATEFCIQHAKGVFPQFSVKTLFNPYRETLYTIEELYEGFDDKKPDSVFHTVDARIYQEFMDTGKAGHISSGDDFTTSLTRRMHDGCITEALRSIIHGHNVCAIMGGHKLARGSKAYRDAAYITRELSRKGFICISGGGPGAMEAGNLGCWFKNRTKEELDAAIDELSQASIYSDRLWLTTAFQVRRKYPATNDCISLGIPTFFYGHEHSNVFQTHVAKFFANSVREDALLSIAMSGIVYFPGSAGTIQELFQDACQNHYETYGASPMILYDSKFWLEEIPAYSLLKLLAKTRPYSNLISVQDEPEGVLAELFKFQISTQRLAFKRSTSVPNPPLVLQPPKVEGQ